MNANSREIETLEQKINEQKKYLEHWRKPSEALLLETVRTLDTLYCQELFVPNGSPEIQPISNSHFLSWGGNNALSLVFPAKLNSNPFVLFPSKQQTQQRTEEFLLQNGILGRAEFLLGLLREGLLSASIDSQSSNLPSGIKKVMVLESNDPFLMKWMVARENQHWISSFQMDYDQDWELQVARRHEELYPEMEKSVDTFQFWGINYTTTKELDKHFLQCGQLYLRRMWGQDLLGREDKIGGFQFNEYLGVLAALGGRAQKHLCFASILKRRSPNLKLQNLLTSFAHRQEFVEGLAEHLDAETDYIRQLLECLTLSPSNLDVHLQTSEPAWAPVIHASKENYILPLYGMEINPFLFLLNDLKGRFAKDWSRLANNRENRWLADLRALFPQVRWEINDRNLKIKKDGKVTTDLDFIAYDKVQNQLAIFQLKWQQPTGFENRSRRSAGKNLSKEGNKWINAVLSWLSENGIEELARRAQIKINPDVKIHLFVIGRYNVFFSGFSTLDDRATWVNWNHFLKARVEHPKASFAELKEILNTEIEEVSQTLKPESYMIPLRDLAILVNPVSTP